MEMKNTIFKFETIDMIWEKEQGLIQIKMGNMITSFHMFELVRIDMCPLYDIEMHEYTSFEEKNLDNSNKMIVIIHLKNSTLVRVLLTSIKKADELYSILTDIIIKNTLYLYKEDLNEVYNSN